MIAANIWDPPHDHRALRLGKEKLVVFEAVRLQLICPHQIRSSESGRQDAHLARQSPPQFARQERWTQSLVCCGRLHLKREFSISTLAPWWSIPSTYSTGIVSSIMSNAHHGNPVLIPEQRSASTREFGPDETGQHQGAEHPQDPFRIQAQAAILP